MSWQEYPRLGERLYRKKLENGLTLMVVPRPGFQKKLVYFATDYGSIHTQYRLDGVEMEAPAGVAHYLEHKLFDMPWGEVSADFAALGANPNAFTSYDMTAYYFAGTENFEQCLRLLLEFVSTPYFSQESVDKERGIIGQEIDMVADTPDTKVFENLMEAMYESHPIRVPILGTRETIANITPQVLETCHRAFYNPENMILCVVGDVDAEAVERIALEILGAEKRPGGVKRNIWKETMSCPRQEVVQQMEVAMPMFQLGFKCPAADRGEAAVLAEMVGDLAAEALFGESSRLYLRLYEEGLIDSSFGGGFETVDGMAMLTASGDSEDPWAVRDAIFQGARELLEEGIGEETFLRMKRSALGRRIRGLDSFDATCFRLCAYHFTDYDYFRFPELFENLKQEQVLDFIAQTVNPAGCCLSVITPKDNQ